MRLLAYGRRQCRAELRHDISDVRIGGHREDIEGRCARGHGQRPLFCNEPDLDLAGHSAALRPVDAKGMCSEGFGDTNDPYWRTLCSISGVDYDVLPLLETTLGRVSVKASYNGGFAVTVREAGIFGRALDYFHQSICSGLVPKPGTKQVVLAGHGIVSGRGSELWGSSQACLSLAVWGSGLSVRTLPPSHNFPLNMWDAMTRMQRATPLTIVHYRRLLAGDALLNPLLNGTANVTPEFVAWLHSQSDHVQAIASASR